MIKIIFLLIFNFVFSISNLGCGLYLDSEIKSPGWVNLHQNIEVVDKNDLSRITNFIYISWYENFGFKTKEEENLVFDNVSNLGIEWVLEIPNEWTPLIPKNYIIMALTTSDQHIIINENYKDIFINLYTHEFVHIVLWTINKEPDPDHEFKEYKGWTENHTNWIRKVEVSLQNSCLLYGSIV